MKTDEQKQSIHNRTMDNLQKEQVVSDTELNEAKTEFWSNASKLLSNLSTLVLAVIDEKTGKGKKP